MEKRIIIGHKGEIGKAIFEIFNATDGVDKNYRITSGINVDRTVMHICIPYNDRFICDIHGYIQNYNPDILLIHSTVPIGTTRKLWNSYELGAVRPRIAHCPVNCRHPNTKKDIMKYDMFVGTIYNVVRNDICDYIERFGITTYPCDTPESTEFCKIASTEFCRAMISFYGDMKQLADKDEQLNWKECIAYFENIQNNSDVWKRVYRRGYNVDTEISGKHCLESNRILWRRYIGEL